MSTPKPEFVEATEVSSYFVLDGWLLLCRDHVACRYYNPMMELVLHEIAYPHCAYNCQWKHGDIPVFSSQRIAVAIACVPPRNTDWRLGEETEYAGHVKLLERICILCIDDNFIPLDSI